MVAMHTLAKKVMVLKVKVMTVVNSAAWLACTVVAQETEGELFKRKSQWSEGYAAFMEHWSHVISFFTLWKTSIQRVEGKHGQQPTSTTSKAIVPDLAATCFCRLAA